MIDMDSVIGMKYKEKIITIGIWSLHLRDKNVKGSGYLAMIGHTCPNTVVYRLRNGERNPCCTLCRDPIPDEIWGLWQLLCNDQRRNYDIVSF